MYRYQDNRASPAQHKVNHQRQQNRVRVKKMSDALLLPPQQRYSQATGPQIPNLPSRIGAKSVKVNPPAAVIRAILVPICNGVYHLEARRGALASICVNSAVGDQRDVVPEPAECFTSSLSFTIVVSRSSCIGLNDKYSQWAYLAPQCLISKVTCSQAPTVHDKTVPPGALFLILTEIPFRSALRPLPKRTLLAQIRVCTETVPVIEDQNRSIN